jgi:hypothetical protein
MYEELKKQKIKELEGLVEEQEAYVARMGKVRKKWLPCRRLFAGKISPEQGNRLELVEGGREGEMEGLGGGAGICHSHGEGAHESWCEGSPLVEERQKGGAGGGTGGKRGTHGQGAHETQGA